MRIRAEVADLIDLSPTELTRCQARHGAGTRLRRGTSDGASEQWIRYRYPSPRLSKMDRELCYRGPNEAWPEP